MKKLSIVLSVLFICILAGCTVSSAKVLDISVTDKVDDDGKAVGSKSEFSKNDPKIYVAAKAIHVPEGTDIKIVWKYNDGSGLREANKATLTLDEAKYFYASLASDKGFLVGNYVAEIYVNDREKPDQTIKFSVK